MRFIKANIAGLASPQQQSEMKSILAGAWPPLKPLPVFKYETPEYRATIDFDKRRGEWVCRKTSFPSNEVQELRGGLREITLALPHDEREAEVLTGGAAQQEQELEKDASRRLQAIHDWREKYENGARYFELRDYLSEGQRTEMDDSLRLSLTARQLQFSPKNVADVFDDLAIAGGRFAKLIEFARGNKAKQGIASDAQEKGASLEAESAIDRDNSPLTISSRELGPANDDPSIRTQEATERCADAGDFPAVSIKSVLPEPQPDQASVAEQFEHTAPQQFETDASEIIATSEIGDTDAPSLVEHPVEHPHKEEHRSAAFAAFAARVRARQSSADRFESWSSRFPGLDIAAFKFAVLGLPLLFAVIAFAVGLSVGRSPAQKRPRETAKPLPAVDRKSPTPEQAYESTSRITTPPVAISDESSRSNRLDDSTPSAEGSKESAGGSEYSAEVRSADSGSSPKAESEPLVKPGVNSGRREAIGPMSRNVSPPARSKLAYSPKVAGAINSAPRGPSGYRLTSTILAAPRLPRPSTILVTVPGRASQSFRVSFPKKTLAATSSFAMTSQLSVLVSPEPRQTVAHERARLEAGELLSFVWPRYTRPAERYGSAETIRVRATIGQLGQVQDVKLLSGSATLLPATLRAIRQWHYRPTLLDKRPVQFQQDVTIEFRPPLYSSRLSAQRPSHN